MSTQDILSPDHWSARTFGCCQLKDIRRTARAVKAATRMAANPSASLPAHMQSWKERIALYQLLDDKDVTFEFLMQPHEPQTRQQLEARSLVLRVADTTGVDLSHHPQTTGLSQVGNERGRGLYLQTVLTILSENGGVSQCAIQEFVVCTSAPSGETRSQCRHRLPSNVHIAERNRKEFFL